tara:strand:+ start:116 stop:748 length:633 start_codon:yes stop_codon:yes gene_type:complete
VIKFRFYIKYCYHLYCKFFLRFIYKLDLSNEESYFRPSYSDLLNLYKIILKYNPKKCVEIGGGYSTYIILRALEKNYINDGIKPEFLSVEQSDKYLEIHKKYLEKNINKETYNFIKFQKTTLTNGNFSNIIVSVCKDLIISDIDFFYEDRTDHSQYKIAGDAIINIYNSSKKFIIIIDGMFDTVNFYKKILRKDYYISNSFFHGTTFIPK